MPPAAPPHIRAASRMIDAHGRVIRDLRISITDRCNFRCLYCMEPDVQFAPREHTLTTHEIVRIARIAQSLGVRKVRLTGGEPTLHPNLTTIIARLRESASDSVEIAMITNASRLSRGSLREWKVAGLDRITISMDTLRPDRFARITRSSCTPDDVLSGIEACLVESLSPLKLNAVLLRGQNDDEAVELASLARRFGIDVRFIEYMPLDSAHAWRPSLWVSAAETRAAIERRFPLRASECDDPEATARMFTFADGLPGRIGFIAPISTPFCGMCSRLRLTADGKLRPCLFSTTEWDLLPLLRSGAGDVELASFMIDATWTKQPGHGIAAPGFRQPARPMSAIGG